MYTATTATKKLLQLNNRTRGIAGGTSASKTISILLWLIDYAQCHNDKLISIVSETMPHLRKGAIRDFTNIMQTHNYWDDSKWNKTDSIYTFDTGSKIEFFSADQPGKVRGPRRDILFINEANNVPYETFDQLEVRTKDIVWLDWNPVSEFWWYKFPDSLENRGVKDLPHTDFLILTYKDNEALDKAIIESIESHKDNKNWWRVYGEGKLGMVEGVIYPHFKQIDEVPEEARLMRIGVDFGYTNDPTAILRIYKWNGAYIWDEFIYRKGMSNRDIADVLLNTDTTLVIADSAEPKSIDEIKSYGVNILPAQKGPGSILQGIQFVQDQVIYVTKKSLNIWNEQRQYLWLTDKEGRIINEPSPFMNHLMDAGRYGMESLKEETPIPIGMNDFSAWRI